MVTVLLTPGAAALLPKGREAKSSFKNYPEISEDLLASLNWCCSGWLCAITLAMLTAAVLSSPGAVLLLPQNLHWGPGQEEQSLLFQAVGHKKDIQQPVIRNTQDLSPLPTARLSLPQSHEPDSDRGNSNSHLATSKFMPCPSMGELEQWTDVPEGFPLPLAPTLLQPLMSLFTKEPTSENNINGKMQLKLSELPRGHDSTWVRGCL